MNCNYPRRSTRLAAKPRVTYKEETVLPEKEQRRRDKRAYELRGGLTWNQFVAAVRTECRCTYAEAIQEASRRQKGAAPRSATDFEPARLKRITECANAVRVSAEKAIVRQQAAKQRRAEQIIRWLEQELAVLDSMPTTLQSTEPLRRSCATPTCDEQCAHCRANERLGGSHCAVLTSTGPESIPQIAFRGLAPVSNAEGVGGLAPPPIGATVVRMPIDLSHMTVNALHELIAAAQHVLANK